MFQKITKNKCLRKKSKVKIFFSVFVSLSVIIEATGLVKLRKT